MRIFKYILALTPEQHVGKETTILMPTHRKILSVGVQDGQIILWAQVGPNLDKVRMSFFIVWTGDNVPAGEYQGTVTVDGLVYHIYGGHMA